jgi:probable addiction module antidote protein
MPTVTHPWDPAEHLDSDEAVAAYIAAALEDGDPALLAAALGDVARARGMSDIARAAGLSRESLYRSLSADGNPSLDTFLKVAKALGLRLSVVPDRDAAQ